MKGLPYERKKTTRCQAGERHHRVGEAPALGFYSAVAGFTGQWGGESRDRYRTPLYKAPVGLG